MLTLEKSRVWTGVVCGSGVTEALGDRAERPAKRTDRSSSWSSMKRGSREKSSGGKKDIAAVV